jgi:hypothetical protein
MILDGEDRLICEQRDPKTGQIVTSIIREIKDDDENVLVEVQLIFKFILFFG